MRKPVVCLHSATFARLATLALLASVPVFADLPAPSNLTATPGNAQVTLQWTASAGAAAYGIYRGLAPRGESPTPIAVTSSTSFGDTAVVNGTTYYYTVRALDTVAPSAYSNEVSATPSAPLRAPSAPALAAVGSSAQVQLIWTAPAETAAFYTLLRGTTAGGETLFASNLTGTTYTDTSVTNGTTYYYTIIATNPAGTSPSSNEVSATPGSAQTVPASPTGLIASGANQMVTLNWTAPAPPVTSYTILRGLQSGGETPLATGVPGTSYIDTTVTNGVKYFYKVAATNTVGTGPASSEVSAVPAPKLPAPTSLMATAGNNQVTLYWGASAGAVLYGVYRGTSAGAEGAQPIATSVTTSYIDTRALNGTTFFYKVRALDTVAPSDFSNEVSATPSVPAVVPSAPTLSAALDGSTVRLTWTTPREPVSSYTIQRGVSSGQEAPLASVAANQYADTGVVSGTTYYYKAVAVNALGSGPASNEVSVTIPVSTGAARTFIAVLTPQNNQVTGGSGQAALTLAADRKSARLKFNYTNLTTPKISEHIHGPANQTENAGIIFDIDTASRQADGSVIWNIGPVGALNAQQILDALLTGRTYINIHSSKYPAGEIRGQFQEIVGSTTFVPPPPPPALPGPPVTTQDAARFLQQASFGPAPGDIQQVQAIGIPAYIDRQFSLPIQQTRTAYLKQQEASGRMINAPDVEASIWRDALIGQDQLRQRVALALSEIMVVSFVKGSLENDVYGMSAYWDLLKADAFGNFRKLLEDVTLSEAMGLYLDMLQNTKEEPDQGLHPNQNYAREIMQLFSIGLNQLHPDGTVKLDASGAPIPTYNLNVILDLSRVFTGWSYPGQDPRNPDLFWYPNDYDPKLPMTFFAEHHDTGPKTLLNGFTIPANQTGPMDLKAALDNIFQHPNCGPFIAKQLIQKLVTSNPSPGYVYRVAQVFNNNGSGVRGDLKAVVKAILTDYEARSVDVLSNQGFGKAKEPMIKTTQLLRAFGFLSSDGTSEISYTEGNDALSQAPLYSPTVFNFFRPDFVQPGDPADAGLVAPEFQIMNESSLIAMGNFLGSALANGINDTTQLNLSPLVQKVNDPPGLLDLVDLMLFAKTMPANMRSTLLNLVNSMPNNSSEEKVRALLFVVINSPQYAIQK